MYRYIVSFTPNDTQVYAEHYCEEHHSPGLCLSDSSSLESSCTFITHPCCWRTAWPPIPGWNSSLWELISGKQIAAMSTNKIPIPCATVTQKEAAVAEPHFAHCTKTVTRCVIGLNLLNTAHETQLNCNVFNFHGTCMFVYEYVFILF